MTPETELTMSDIHELAAQMAAGGPPDILAGSPKEEIGEWFREGFPHDGERSALAAAIVTNCSLLPTSLLRNIHELVLTHCQAATGIAVQDLEEANLIWDNVDSFDALMELIDITVQEMP